MPTWPFMKACSTRDRSGDDPRDRRGNRQDAMVETDRAARPPHLDPDASGDKLAVVNGQWLYVVNRFTGEPVYETEMKDAPGAGPALSSQHVYVPMVSGMVIAYPLKLSRIHRWGGQGEEGPDRGREGQGRGGTAPHGPAVEQHTPPLFCRSYGRAMVQPLVTRDNVGGEYTVWPTDRGYLNLARIDREAENAALMLKYRLETGSKIVARAGYLPPDPKVTGDSGWCSSPRATGWCMPSPRRTGRRCGGSQPASRS